MRRVIVLAPDKQARIISGLKSSGVDFTEYPHSLGQAVAVTDANALARLLYRTCIRSKSTNPLQLVDDLQCNDLQACSDLQGIGREFPHEV
jgi:hypothetical protein